jgi:hypothetical protein
MSVDGRRERSVYARDSRGRFGRTLATDERCPAGLGNRTGYHDGCRCTYCTAANTAYFGERRRRRAQNRRLR